MNILFNGKPIETGKTVLKDILQEQGFSCDSHVATAVNGMFIAKDCRDTTVIHADDTIEVVAPMQGG